MIIIESKRKKPATILKKYPDAIMADVTSGAKDGLVKLSPFYPHGDIPVPFSEGHTATCVEAIWQGLKVFEGCDVDTSLFTNNTMKGLKRTVRKYGKPLGHRKGVNGKELLSYDYDNKTVTFKLGGRETTMSKTVVRKNESLDDALRRFKRSVSKTGTLQEYRKREFYEKPSVKRKKKSEAARKRKNKRRF